jgi:uncharacterized protein YjiS (DUF1127 family)
MLSSLTAAYTSLRQNAGAEPSLVERLVAPLAAWVRQRREMRRIIAELETYTPRQLRELHLTRSDIPDVARGTYRRG